VSVYQRPVNGQVRARRWRYERQHNTQIFFCFSAHLDAARISRRGRRGPDDYFTSATFMLLFTKRRRPGGRAATRPSVGLTTLLFYFATTAPPPGRRPTHGRLLTCSLTHGCFSRTSSDKTTKNLVAASE